MKRILGYTLMLLAVGVAFTSCSDDDSITPAPLPTGAQVFFRSDLPSTFDVTKAESQLAIPIYRANTSGAATVAITAEQEENSIYKVPASVEFADGEETTNIVITYDPDDIEYGVYEKISLELDKNVSTPYGFSKTSFNVGATEWVSMGMATFRANFFGAFGVSAQTYQVEIQQSVVVDGIYRLVNPFGAAFPSNEPGDWDTSKDYYMVIDATDPDYVWVPVFASGVDWGYGPTNFASEVQYYLDKGYDMATIKSSSPESFGQLENGVISFPSPGTFTMGFGEAYAQYSDNRDGLNAIAFPGYRIADYSLEYEYLGRFIDTDKQYYVEGIATFGEDVAYGKAALVTEETYEGVYDAIVAGTYEDAVTVTDGVAFRLPFSESGTYYVLIVAYNADGEVAAELTSKVKAEIEGGVQTINWEAQYVGDYYYDLFSDPDNEEYEIDEGLTLYVDADNESHYQIAPWGNEKTLEFIWNEDGSITVPEGQATGLSGQKGELFVTDVQTYTEGNEKYADYVSSYSKNVFTFYLVYYNDGEAYIGADTFTLTGKAEVKQAVRIGHKRLGKLNNAKRSMRPILCKAAKYVPSL